MKKYSAITLLVLFLTGTFAVACKKEENTNTDTASTDTTLMVPAETEGGGMSTSATSATGTTGTMSTDTSVSGANATMGTAPGTTTEKH